MSIDHMMGMRAIRSRMDGIEARLSAIEIKLNTPAATPKPDGWETKPPNAIPIDPLAQEMIDKGFLKSRKVGRPSKSDSIGFGG